MTNIWLSLSDSLHLDKRTNIQKKSTYVFINQTHVIKILKCKKKLHLFHSQYYYSPLFVLCILGVMMPHEVHLSASRNLVFRTGWILIVDYLTFVIPWHGSVTTETINLSEPMQSEQWSKWKTFHSKKHSISFLNDNNSDCLFCQPSKTIQLFRT